MHNFKRCTRCVMDNKSGPYIEFYDDGTCNYCTEALKRMNREYFPNDIGEKILNEIVGEIKKEAKGKEFDCVLGVSGGG